MRKLLMALSIGVLLLTSMTTLEAQQPPRGIAPCSPNSLSVTGTSSNAQLSTCGNSLILMNLSSQEAFYKVGSASTTAATTTVTDSYSLPGNAYELITVPGLTGTPGVAGWYIAAITATSTTTIRIIQGNAQ